MVKKLNLTEAEEEIMIILWKISRGFVKDVLQEFEAPKPAYNTVSTIIRILVEKGYIAYEAFGRSHRYFPLINKDAYRSGQLMRLRNKYFNNSFESMVSFFVKDQKMDIATFEALIKELKKEKNDK